MNDSSVFTWVGRLHRSFAIDILKIKGLREKFSHLSILRAGTWQGLYWSSLMIFFRFSFFFDNGLICKQFFFSNSFNVIRRLRRLHGASKECLALVALVQSTVVMQISARQQKQWRVKRYESLHHTYCSVRTSMTTNFNMFKSTLTITT